jgi:starch-binding outer membrane protein, SusD/RagB family
MRIQTDRVRSAMRKARVLPLLLLPGLGACDALLDVDNPGSVDARDLNNPLLAETLVNSALGRFECAYTSYVASTGILSGEFINSSTWLDVNSWGWRGVELFTIVGSCPGGRNATSLGAYAPLQQARYLAEDNARLIQGFPDDLVPAKNLMLGRLAAYAGYSTLLLGEGFCEMAIDESPLMPRQQVVARAEERFTSAIALAQAAANEQLRLLAVAGRARSRLNQGNLTGAASDAEQIPEGFVWYAEYSTIDGSRENRLFNLNRRNRVLSVDPIEYGSLELGGEPDPRVPAMNSGLVGHDQNTPHWYQDKYRTADAFIPMASWAEAQLILAEARPAEAEAAINRLRTSQGLPAYQPSGDHLADVLEERRRQLFLEGHRFNDMLRHNLGFPQGTNHKGQAYGPVTCMPLPEQERRNNPNIN